MASTRRVQYKQWYMVFDPFAPAVLAMINTSPGCEIIRTPGFNQEISRAAGSGKPEGTPDKMFLTLFIQSRDNRLIISLGEHEDSGIISMDLRIEEENSRHIGLFDKEICHRFKVGSRRQGIPVCPGSTDRNEGSVTV